MGCAFHPIQMDNKGTSPIKDMLLYRQYLKALRHLRPDAFLGYTVKPNVYGSLAAQKLGIRVINNVSGLGTAFIRKNILTRIVCGLYRRAFARSEVVFFQNNDDRGVFLSLGLVDRQKTKLLPGSGIDLKRFSPCCSSDACEQGASSRVSRRPVEI